MLMGMSCTRFPLRNRPDSAQFTGRLCVCRTWLGYFVLGQQVPGGGAQAPGGSSKHKTLGGPQASVVHCTREWSTDGEGRVRRLLLAGPNEADLAKPMRLHLYRNCHVDPPTPEGSSSM